MGVRHADDETDASGTVGAGDTGGADGVGDEGTLDHGPRREVIVAGGGFPLVETLGHAPSADLCFERFTRDGGEPFLFVSTYGSDRTTVAAALEADSTVRESVLLESDATYQLYRTRLTPQSAAVIETCLDHGVDPARVESARSGFLVSVPVDSVDALSEVGLDFDQPSAGPDPVPVPNPRVERWN
jgi:hypothetical protein